MLEVYLSGVSPPNTVMVIYDYNEYPLFSDILLLRYYNGPSVQFSDTLNFRRLRVPSNFGSGYNAGKATPLGLK